MFLFIYSLQALRTARFFLLLLLIIAGMIASIQRALRREITYLFRRLPIPTATKPTIERATTEKLATLVKIVLWNTGTTLIKHKTNGPAPSIQFQFTEETIPTTILHSKNAEASIDPSTNTLLVTLTKNLFPFDPLNPFALFHTSIVLQVLFTHFDEKMTTATTIPGLKGIQELRGPIGAFYIAQLLYLLAFLSYIFSLISAVFPLNTVFPSIMQKYIVIALVSGAIALFCLLLRKGILWRIIKKIPSKGL
jgi:hypothetical protein